MALVDIILINVCFLLAYWIRFLGDVPEKSFEPFLTILPWLSVATFLVFLGLGLYEKRRNGFYSTFRSVLISVIVLFMIAMALTFWFRGFNFPRSVLLMGAGFQVILVGLWRFGCWYLEKSFHGLRNMIIIGEVNEVEKLLEKVLDLSGWYKVKRVLEPSNTNQLKDYLDEVDSVLLVPSLSEEKKAKAMAVCQGSGKEVFLVPDFYNILIGNAKVGQIDDLPVMEIQDISLTRLQRIYKRTLDLFISSLGLVLASPVMLACMLLIRFTSPGPVFFTQRRVGRGGRTFSLYKFRTMVQDAEEKTGPVLASEKDPRITPVGRFMRTTRLDELPQLINVFKGEMSFVGPRPERPFFVKEFEQEFPNYGYRHLVKPGITGLAQVSGKYTTYPEDKLRFDLYYIRNYSLMLDLKIILQTVPVLLSRESSAGRKNDRETNRDMVHHLVNGNIESAAGRESRN